MAEKAEWSRTKRIPELDCVSFTVSPRRPGSESVFDRRNHAGVERFSRRGLRFLVSVRPSGLFSSWPLVYAGVADSPRGFIGQITRTTNIPTVGNPECLPVCCNSPYARSHFGAEGERERERGRERERERRGDSRHGVNRVYPLVHSDSLVCIRRAPPRPLLACLSLFNCWGRGERVRQPRSGGRTKTLRRSSSFRPLLVSWTMFLGFSARCWTFGQLAT